MQAAPQNTGAISLFSATAEAKQETDRIFALQKQAYQSEGQFSYKKRKALLKKLYWLVIRNRVTFSEAISRDFGNRSQQETILTEVNGLLANLKYTQHKLRSWMRPKRKQVSIWFMPGGNRTVPQALGVVGIMVPWNYPLHLSLTPAVAALAAGNRVMIKMPEAVPELTGLMKRLVRENFQENEMVIIDGDAEVAKHFSSKPFDHLFFTGSTAIGREVMKAAAENLTPVTLELGGKSPVLVDHNYSIKEAAKRTTWGRLFSAGQTCVAADYALVPKGEEHAFAEAAIASARKMYPDLKNNPDYTSIVNDTEFRRLKAAVDEAVVGGATLYTAESIDDTDKNHKFPLSVLVNCPENCTAMTEENFGPVLPIIGYETFDDALAFINDRPVPLAAYYFGSGRNKSKVIRDLRAGGMTINDTLLHYLQNDLPFGGVGASGIGSYHGKEGFDTFSHNKAVFIQRGALNFTGAKLLYPPYGRMAAMLLKMMRVI